MISYPTLSIIIWIRPPTQLSNTLEQSRTELKLGIVLHLHQMVWYGIQNFTFEKVSLAPSGASPNLSPTAVISTVAQVDLTHQTIICRKIEGM